MQVYKTFFKIAKKYLSSCIIYFSIFIVLLIAMSKLGTETTNSRFEADTVNFAVIDNDNTTASEALLDYLTGKHELITLDDYSNESLQDYMYYEKIEYVLIIPDGYEDNLLRGKTENILSHSMKTDSAKGFFFNQDVNAYLDCLKLYLGADYSLSEALDATKDTIEATADTKPESITFEEKNNNIVSGMTSYFQYMAYVMMSGLIIAVSPILITFHKRNLQERLACSSTAVRTQSIGIGLGCITYCIAAWLILMVVAMILYRPENMFSETGLMFILNSFVYTICITLITLIIGSFNLETNALNLISNVFGLGTSFLCGIFVPLWYLSDKVLIFSQFLPTYWYVKNINMISGASGEAFSKATYWNYIGIEVIFIAALFAIFLLANTQRKKKAI